MEDDDLARIHRLVGTARGALSFERTMVAGRQALRIQSDVGVSTTFLTPAEAIAFDALIHQAAPRLSDPRFPECVWNAERHHYAGEFAGVQLRIYDLSIQPSAESVSHVAAMFSVASQALPLLPELLAEHFADNAKSWNETAFTPTQLAAKFTATALCLSGDSAGSPTFFFDDGDVFAGHSIEVFLDASGHFAGAQLAG